MSSLSALQARQIAAEGKVVQVGTDTPVAIRLRYVGTGTVTSVTVTTATNIVMVTSDGGTDTYAFATYTTVGSLVDAINTDGIFQAIVLDSLRSKATASQFVDGAITLSTSSEGYSIWDVKLDTSAALYFAARLSITRLFTRLKRGHRVHLQTADYAINMGTAAADSAQIWEIASDGVTETKVFTDLSVDTTATSISFASGQGRLTSPDGGAFVFLVKDAATLADASSNYLRVVGSVE